MLAILRIVQFEDPKDLQSEIQFQKYFTIKNGETMILGRSKEVQWQIIDSLSSGKHLKFEMQGGYLFFEDLESKNGTKLNKIRVRERTNLYLDDVITLGATYIHIDADHTPLESRMKLRSPNGRDDKYAFVEEFGELTNPKLILDFD